MRIGSVAFAAAATAVLALDSNHWRSKSIYQLLTDRFAAVPTPPQCQDYSDYCGGTWNGTIAHLDYIQDLGFNAIWTSPVVDNADGGYHGYWQRNMYAVNSRFGTAADLIALSSALHARNMSFMVDIVANHASSNSDVSSNVPFNDPKYYHDCTPCPQGCDVQDYTALPQMEHCRLAGLMDFNQTDPEGETAAQLIHWIQGLLTNYSIDGLRIDTLPYVHPAFWQKFLAEGSKVVPGGLYAVGEVDDGDPAFVSPWQAPHGANAALPGILNYPMFFVLRNVFQQRQSMQALSQAWHTSKQLFSDVGLLGVFVDNHDNPRFMQGQSDRALYQAALAYVLLMDGIPIVYYGSEWLYAGGNDPGCREPLWCPGISYNASAATLGPFLRLLNQYRHDAKVWDSYQQEALSDDAFYAFTKGHSTLAAFTNVGSSGQAQERTVPAAGLPSTWVAGTTVCNLFNCKDCAVVAANGSLAVTVQGAPGVAVFDPRNKKCSE